MSRELIGALYKISTNFQVGLSPNIDIEESLTSPTVPARLLGCAGVVRLQPIGMVQLLHQRELSGRYSGSDLLCNLGSDRGRA